MSRTRPPIDQVEAFIAKLSDAERRAVEQNSGKCCTCFFVGAGECNHLSERADDKALDRMRVNTGPILRQAFALAAASHSGTLSHIESRLLEAFWRYDLAPELQYEIGPYTVDFAFPDARLVVEADGAAYHTDEAKERARDDYLKRQGWIVRHLPGWRIYQDADECVMTVYHLARQS